MALELLTGAITNPNSLLEVGGAGNVRRCNVTGISQRVSVTPTLAAPWRVYGWGVTLYHYIDANQPAKQQIQRFANIDAILSGDQVAGIFAPSLPQASLGNPGVCDLPRVIIDQRRLYDPDTEASPPLHPTGNPPFAPNPGLVTAQMQLPTPLQINAGDELYISLVMSGLLAGATGGYAVGHAIPQARYVLQYEIIPRK